MSYAGQSAPHCSYPHEDELWAAGVAVIAVVAVVAVAAVGVAVAAGTEARMRGAFKSASRLSLAMF